MEGARWMKPMKIAHAAKYNSHWLSLEGAPAAELRPFLTVNFVVHCTHVCTINAISFQVYIIVSVSKAKALGYITWNYGDSNDTIAREAFRSVLLLEPDVSVYAISNRTSNKAINTGYVSPYKKYYPISEAPLAIVSSSMAAFLMLGMVLEEMWSGNATGGYVGGRQLTKKFLNRSFDLGFVQFDFDEYGQRLIHEELSDMDPVTGEFRVSFEEESSPNAVVRKSLQNNGFCCSQCCDWNIREPRQFVN
ncbi:hypothetical protein RvY_16398-1 [Ramazzottius varieornatus]|uniref:Receptor ligand binding region domain-containing protein n=1 Tax=Ramazzottius varieornatus TaxID=947166 RepID=A0A1D1VYA3_RAMVA|nr:hypothetical protein RvY_16398-1 [Ramazzottius varieornatus]